MGEELASQIMKGGSSLGSNLKSILGEGVQVKGLGDNAKISDVASLATAGAGALAGTIVGGKTKSDIDAVGVYKSPQEYAEAQGQKASSMATVDQTRLEKSQDQKQTQKKLDYFIKNANDPKLAESQAIRSGAVEMDGNKPVRNSDGSLKATTGSKFTNALSKFGAGDMASTSQLIMGGQRINMDTDMDGNILANRDSQENVKKGWKEDLGVSGIPEHILGAFGTGMLGMSMGIGATEGLYRKFGPKGNEGLVKPAVKGTVNKFAESFGFEKPFGSVEKEATNGSNPNNNGETRNGTNTEQKNGVNHNETPRTANFAGQQNEHHSANQPKSIISKMRDAFKSPKGKAAMSFAAVSTLGYALFGGEDASAAEFPNVNPEKALAGAKEQIKQESKNPLVSKPTPNLPQSNTVLDNTANDTGMFALGASVLGLASKTVARVAPVAGEVYSVADTANRTMKGDYIGAAESAFIGFASNFPVGGTAASLAGVGVQAATDYIGITGGDSSQPEQSSQKSTTTSKPISVDNNTTESGPIKSNQTTSSVDSNGVVGFNNLNGTTTPNVQGLPTQSGTTQVVNTFTQQPTQSQPIQAVVDSSAISLSVSNALSNMPSASSAIPTASAPSESTSMGGGHVGAVLSESKVGAEVAAGKATAISTEHASNDYIQTDMILSELVKSNQVTDDMNKLKTDGENFE